MSNRRPSIPSRLVRELLYANASACAICQENAVQIHHIDQDHSNNSAENLVVVCVRHHAEAHTQYQMSKNLTPELMKMAKAAWEEKVRAKRESRSTLEGQRKAADSFSAVGIAWGYINHSRVVQNLDHSILRSVDQRLLTTCKQRNLVDDNGIILPPESKPIESGYIRNSIYDGYPVSDGHRIHFLYSSFVDEISRRAKPIFLDSSTWSKEYVEDLLKPGGFAFCQRGFDFRSIEETSTNDHRRVRASAKQLTLEFFVNTRDMFGTSSMTVSFTGRKICSALLQLKSIVATTNGGRLLECTPFALGLSFERN